MHLLYLFKLYKYVHVQDRKTVSLYEHRTGYRSRTVVTIELYPFCTVRTGTRTVRTGTQYCIDCVYCTQYIQRYFDNSRMRGSLRTQDSSGRVTLKEALAGPFSSPSLLSCPFLCPCFFLSFFHCQFSLLHFSIASCTHLISWRNGANPCSRNSRRSCWSRNRFRGRKIYAPNSGVMLATKKP